MPNDMTLYLVVGIVLLYFIMKFSKKKNNGESTEREYEKEVKREDINYLPYTAKYVLTKNEYDFYTILKENSIIKKYVICPKVGLKDMFNVTDKKEYMKYFAKISKKHIDFLLCDENLKPQFAIELDDKSHSGEKAKYNDDFKNRLFEKTNVKLIRVKALPNGSYTNEYVEKHLLQIKDCI